MPSLPPLTFKRCAFFDPSDPRRPIPIERRIEEWGRLSVEWERIEADYIEGYGDGTTRLIASERLVDSAGRADSHDELRRIRRVSETYLERGLAWLDECELILWQVSRRTIEVWKIQRQELIESMTSALLCVDAAIEVVEAADLVRPYLKDGRMMGPDDGHGPRFMRAITESNEAFLAHKRLMADIEFRRNADRSWDEAGSLEHVSPECGDAR